MNVAEKPKTDAHTSLPKLAIEHFMVWTLGVAIGLCFIRVEQIFEAGAETVPIMFYIAIILFNGIWAFNIAGFVLVTWLMFRGYRLSSASGHYVVLSLGIIAVASAFLSILARLNVESTLASQIILIASLVLQLPVLALGIRRSKPDIIRLSFFFWFGFNLLFLVMQLAAFLTGGVEIGVVFYITFFCLLGMFVIQAACSIIGIITNLMAWQDKDWLHWYGAILYFVNFGLIGLFSVGLFLSGFSS